LYAIAEEQTQHENTMTQEAYRGAMAARQSNREAGSD
jgi:hypothetical protein